MKNKRFIFYLSVLLLSTVFFNTGGIRAKDNAVKLLEADWEDIHLNSNNEMLIYYLEIEELEFELGKELELRLSTYEDVQEEKSLIIINNELEKADWPGLFIKGKNHSMNNSNNSVYHSWIITIPGKKAEINLNNILISGENTDILDCIRIIMEPLQVSREEVFTFFTLEYKSYSGTVSRIEIGVWSNKEEKRPLLILKQRIAKGNKEDYKYFALYLNSQYIEGNFLNPPKKILVINSINGIKDFFELGVLDDNPVKLGAYINNDGGGFEFLRRSGDDSFSSSVFINKGKLNYHMSLDKGLIKDSGLSGIISLKNKENDSIEPYVMCGISDKLNYSNDLKCQLIYYPAIISYRNSKNPSTAAELRVDYEKEPFGLEYRIIYLNGEYENRAKLNYKISSSIAISTIWKEKDYAHNYYFGIIYEN